MAVLTKIIGVLANICGISLSFSPAPAIIEGLKTMEIKSLTNLYFIIAIVQGVFWMNFGLKRNDFLIYAPNIIGLTLFIGYLNCLFYIKKTYECFYYNIGFVVQFIFCNLCLSGTINSICATIVQCFWQATTLETLKKALTFKDPSFINILLMYVSFTNFVLWILYGILSDALILSFVNTISGIFAFINIYIYFWAERKIPDDACLIINLKNLLNINKENNKDIIERIQNDNINNVNDFQTPMISK